MPFTTLDHLGKWKSSMKGETMLRFNGPEVAGNRLAAGRILPIPHPHIYICHKFVFLLKFAADPHNPTYKLKLLRNKPQPQFTNPSEILNGGKQ